MCAHVLCRSCRAKDIRDAYCQPENTSIPGTAKASSRKQLCRHLFRSATDANSCRCSWCVFGFYSTTKKLVPSAEQYSCPCRRWQAYPFGFQHRQKASNNHLLCGCLAKLISCPSVITPRCRSQHTPQKQCSGCHLCKASQHVSSLIVSLRVQEPAATSKNFVCCLLLSQCQALGSMNQCMQLIGHGVICQVDAGGADGWTVQAEAKQGWQVEPGLVALIAVATCSRQGNRG